MRRLLVGMLPKVKDARSKYEKVLPRMLARLGEKHYFFEQSRLYLWDE